MRFLTAPKTPPRAKPPKRTYYTTNGAKLANSLFADDYGPEIFPAKKKNATLVGSATGRHTVEGPMHLPCIDIDFPCELIESSTPGHFHLYIDKEISWPAYELILRALAQAGIVQHGYYESARRRGQTFLRKPGVTKKDI